MNHYASLILISLAACNSKTVSDTATAANNVNTWELAICEISSNSPYELSEIVVDGTDLYLTVGYSGGCADHYWELCWDGSIAESMPLQVWFELGHNSNGDSCEAYLSQGLVFDISSLDIADQPVQIHLGGQSVLINGE